MSNTLMTEIGREKLCKAHAGDKALPKVKYIAFGTGGVDSERNPLPVSGKETALRSEQYRIELQHSYPVPTTCNYLSTLNKNDLPNMYISELGFFDEEEDLILYSTFIEIGKSDDMVFEFNIREVF